MYSFAKMSNVRIFVMKQISRRFSTSNIKYDIVRQSKIMNKLLSRNQSKRDPLDLKNTSLFGPTKVESSSRVKRRVNVLNKVFMEYITDLMSTGEMAPKLLNRNIEISHVEVKPNFKLITVFWIDNGLESQPDMPELLNECARGLRQELCNLHVIGIVPPIRFVKYEGINVMKEIEEKLKTLDFGEDYVPTAYPHSINHTVTSQNENSEDKNDIFSVTLPVMRHDVFDLDHRKIMSKIKSSLNKSRVTLNKQKTDAESPLTSTISLQDASNFINEEEQRELFDKFLNQRRKEQKRKYRNKHCRENIIYDVPEQENDDHNYDVYDNYDENDTDDTTDDIDDYYKTYVNREFEDKL